MASLAQKRLFLLDMDGTIYLDHTLFPGTLPFLRRVRERGGRYLFLTNNSSRSVDAYVDKLAGMGEDEQLDLLSTDGMLVKRPLLVGDDFVLVGFKESGWAEKL